jgi:hypothetical protein
MSNGSPMTLAASASRGTNQFFFGLDKRKPHRETLLVIVAVEKMTMQHINAVNNV